MQFIKIFFGPAPHVLSFPKWRKTMEIWKNTRFFMSFHDTFHSNFTVRMLTEELNLSHCTIYTILTDDLGKRKVFARFFPHQLNVPPHKTKKVNEFLMKKEICVMDYPSSKSSVIFGTHCVNA